MMQELVTKNNYVFLETIGKTGNYLMNRIIFHTRAKTGLYIFLIIQLRTIRHQNNAELV